MTKTKNCMKIIYKKTPILNTPGTTLKLQPLKRELLKLLTRIVTGYEFSISKDTRKNIITTK